MQQNAYLLAKFGADTAENEQHFAKNWQPGRAIAAGAAGAPARRGAPVRR